MSKKQRIEDLERRVAELERRLVAQQTTPPTTIWHPAPTLISPTIPSTNPYQWPVVISSEGCGTAYSWN